MHQILQHPNATWTKHDLSLHPIMCALLVLINENFFPANSGSSSDIKIELARPPVPPLWPFLRTEEVSGAGKFVIIYRNYWVTKCQSSNWRQKLVFFSPISSRDLNISRFTCSLSWVRLDIPNTTQSNGGRNSYQPRSYLWSLKVT